LACK